MQLSRAGEAGTLTSWTIGVLGISTKIKSNDRMDERVTSSLCEREFVFPPYDAEQRKEIMAARRDAFRDGVLEAESFDVKSWHDHAVDPRDERD
jgi:cell division control protein 6